MQTSVELKIDKPNQYRGCGISVYSEKLGERAQVPEV